MKILTVANIIFISIISASLDAKELDYIKIKQKNGRYLFHSNKYGEFFSVGSNSFMESAANKDMKKDFKAKPFSVIYEEQLKSYMDFGFNSLGGWSNTENLKDRLPYVVVLFDDEFYPHSSSLKDCNGQELPSGDAEPLANPLNDPFDLQYKKDLKTYLKNKVSPLSKDTSLMLYFIGHEFGIGGSDYVDLSKYTYSKAIKNEFASWLTKKYLTAERLNKSWHINQRTFQEVVDQCPGVSRTELNDRKEFMTYVLRKWFKLVVSEIKKNDPNHLISTPKLSVWDHQSQLDLAKKEGHFEAMKGLFDLISVDWYTANSNFSDKAMSQIMDISSELNLPVLVAEFGTRQKIEGWTNTPGSKALLKSQAERGERYQSQLKQLFENKKFIGAHWFRWQDHITKTDQMNKGIVYVKDNKIEPYLDLKNAMMKVHQEIKNRVVGE